MKLVGRDFALIIGTLVWVLTVVWLMKRGWAVHRRYMVEENHTSMTKTHFVWSSAVIGVLTLVASHQRPGAPAIIMVAMLGFASAIIDIRTHRLPDKYTMMMGMGILVGWATASVVDPSTFLTRWTTSLIGAAIWLGVMLLGRLLGGGIGWGDVKLAPVLGAVVGMVGIHAAFFSLMLTFISAGLAALWLIVTGSTSVHSRIPLGPWMVGSAIAGHLLWGIIPDWIGGTQTLVGA